MKSIWFLLTLLLVLTVPLSAGRDLMLRESCGHFSLRKGQLKYIRPAQEPKPWIEEHKKIEGGLSSKPQLYDLSKDSGETNNLAQQKPELVAELEADLQNLIDNPQR